MKVGDRAQTAALADPEDHHGNPQGLLKRPSRPQAPPALALGLELRTLDPSSARRLNLPGSLTGVAVVKVAPDSPLAAALKPLDVLSAVDGHAVKTAEDAARVLNERAELRDLVLDYERVVKGAIEHRTTRFP